MNKAWQSAGEGVQRSAERAVQAACLGLHARCSQAILPGHSLFHFLWSREGSRERVVWAGNGGPSQPRAGAESPELTEVRFSPQVPSP